MDKFTDPDFLDFLVRKEFDWTSIVQEFSDRLIEDEYNSEIAEKALEISYDLFPDGSDNENDLMDKRHEFVSAFMEYCRCDFIKQQARNLDMVDRKDYESKKIADARVSIHGKAQYYRGIRDSERSFHKMSAYGFSAWKLRYKGGFQDENIAHDSEDETWDAMIALQENKDV